MRTFPDVLPVPSWTDYGLTPRPQSFRTDMEVGDQKARRITRAKRWDVDLGWRMTDEEAGLFWPWYHDDPWALSGDSDSLGHFSMNNATLAADITVGPDGQLADRITENTAVTVGHGATLQLTTVPLNAIVSARMTLRAGTRNFARLTFADWTGLASTAALDLTTGAWTSGANFLSRKAVSRGNGWWRIELTAATGSGATTPFIRINLGQSGTLFNYTGDGVSYVDACEQQLRVVSGADGFLRTDSTGAILGAGAGSAWFNMTVPMGGGMVPREVQLIGPPSAKALNGRPNWMISAKGVVR